MQKKIALKGLTSIDEETSVIFGQGYKGAETYLQNNKFIAGNDLTIADFSVASTVVSLNVSSLKILIKNLISKLP